MQPMKVVAPVVKACLTDQWQSADEISAQCPDLDKWAVRAALRRLSQEGFAVARLCITTPNRILQYKLPGAIE